MCSFLWKGHKNSLVETLQSLLKSDTLLDCTIAAEGQYLRAHKVILAASSPYFKLLFTQEQEKNPIVVLKDVNFQELQCIIEYIYNGEIEVPAGQVKSFLRTAESLQIVGLRGSTQERVDGEDNGSLVATSISPIARKRRKHNHHDDNSRGNSPAEAHFSVTNETPEISPFVATSNLSEHCTSPNFLLRENSVQGNSEIRECVQNFEAASPEILGKNTVETEVGHDLPIAPFVSGELILNNHMSLGGNSIPPAVCDNVTNQVIGQKECVVNSHSMPQEHMVFIKQDPDAVDISEEHFQDGTGYGGGEFLDCNSTVDPQNGVVDVPNMTDQVGGSGFLVVVHSESLLYEDGVRNCFKKCEQGVSHPSSFLRIPESELCTKVPLKRRRGRPKTRHHEERSFDSGHFTGTNNLLTSSASSTKIQRLPSSTEVSEYKTTASLENPTRTLSQYKVSARHKRPHQLSDDLPLALKRLGSRASQPLSEYFLFNSQKRRLRNTPSMTLRQHNKTPKDLLGPPTQTLDKDKVPIKRPRGRPRKSMSYFNPISALKRAHGRQSDPLSKYFAFNPLARPRPSQTLSEDNVTLKRGPGRPRKTPYQTPIKRPRGRPRKLPMDDQTKVRRPLEDMRCPASKAISEVVTSLKRPRGRPSKSLNKSSNINAPSISNLLNESKAKPTVLPIISNLLNESKAKPTVSPSILNLLNESNINPAGSPRISKMLNECSLTPLVSHNISNMQDCNINPPSSPRVAKVFSDYSVTPLHSPRPLKALCESSIFKNVGALHHKSIQVEFK